VCAISGPDTIASTALLPSIKGPGAIHPFERRIAGRVLTQIVDALRTLPRAQIIGGGCQRPLTERRRQPDDYHVWRDELAQADTGTNPSARGRPVPRLQRSPLQLGIGPGERCYQGLQQDRTTARGTERRKSPAGRCPRSRATSLAATSSSKAGFRAIGSARRLRSGPTLRVVRMKSAAPIRVSSARAPLC